MNRERGRAVNRDNHRTPDLLRYRLAITIVSTPATVEVRYGDTSPSADVVIQTSYEAFLDVAEGLMPAEEFTARHVEVIEGAQNAQTFFALMGAAINHQH